MEALALCFQEAFVGALGQLVAPVPFLWARPCAVSPGAIMAGIDLASAPSGRWSQACDKTGGWWKRGRQWGWGCREGPVRPR